MDCMVDIENNGLVAELVSGIKSTDVFITWLKNEY